jgi:hypothetical protein
MKHLTLFILVAGLVAFSLIPALAHPQEQPEEPEISEETRLLIDDVRGETALFRDLDTALDAGYGKFLDCFQHGEELGMGQHYVNADLVGDDILDPMQPEALVYEPREDGTMILVAFEYLVFEDQWESSDPPTLFDREFALKTNIPDTPPVWALHMWLWSHNPEGMFADYNPLVFCPSDQPVVEMAMH